ncbi:MAG: hypothetical protein SGPRY_014023 [Prymnesium sp.]
MAIIRQYDNNVDKRLGLAEFDRLVQDVQRFRAEKGLTSELDAQIKRAFEHFDFDGSGDINAMELRYALEKLGVKASTEDALAVLKAYDADTTRRLGFEEFAKLVRDVIRCSSQDEIDERVRRIFEQFDRDRSGDMNATELRAALAALGVPTEALSRASSLLAIYDADGSVRLSLHEFSRLHDDILRHNYGSYAAIQPALLQRETARLQAIDELFLAYAFTDGTSSVLRYSEVHQLCVDFSLLRDRILSHDHLTLTLGSMQSASKLTNPSLLAPVLRERFDELLYRLALHATEKDPKLQAAKPHVRLHALLDALLLSKPVALRQHIAGLHLLRASEQGACERMSELIQQGAPLDRQDSRGATPLHLAALYGHTRAASVLIGAGSPLQERTADGWTPLLYAAEFGHVGVVSELIRKGVAVEAVNSRGWTALHRAALDGHLQV